VLWDGDGPVEGDAATPVEGVANDLDVETGEEEEKRARADSVGEQGGGGGGDRGTRRVLKTASRKKERQRRGGGSGGRGGSEVADGVGAGKESCSKRESAAVSSTQAKF
jgi:hypothetical protein